jgi:hypothetical protein
MSDNKKVIPFAPPKNTRPLPPVPLEKKGGLTLRIEKSWSQPHPPQEPEP